MSGFGVGQVRRYNVIRRLSGTCENLFHVPRRKGSL